MARPIGSKNKTPEQLKIEADILKKKAEIKIQEKKLKDMKNKRTSI